MEVKRKDLYDFEVILDESELPVIIKASNKWDCSISEALRKIIVTYLNLLNK